MAADPGRLEIGEVGKCGQDRVEGGLFDGGDRARLARQRGLPLVGAVELRENVGSDPLEGVDDGRVVRAPAPRAQPLPRVVAQHDRQIDVSRHQREPHRERNRIAREPHGIALPVPALVRVGEGFDDRLPDARASGQHDGDLAVRGQRAFRALRIGERACDEAPPQRRLAGATLRTNRPIISRPEPIRIGAIAALMARSSPPTMVAVSAASDVQPRKRRSANWWTVRTSSGSHPISSARAAAIVQVRSAWPGG